MKRVAVAATCAGLLAVGVILNAQAPAPFKLGTFQLQNRTFIGIVVRDTQVIDFAAADSVIGRGRDAAPADMKQLIERYDAGVRERIYAVVNEERKEAYVGRTCRPLAERWYEHRRDANDPRKRKRLYEAMRHDPTGFEILECECSETASEAQWLAVFKGDGYLILNDAAPNHAASKPRDKERERTWREINEQAYLRVINVRLD